MPFISFLVIFFNCNFVFYSVLSKCLLCQDVPRIKLALPNRSALRHSCTETQMAASQANTLIRQGTVSWQRGLGSKHGRVQAQTLLSFVSRGSLSERLAWADAPPILCLTPHASFFSLLGYRSERWGWSGQRWASCLLPPPSPHLSLCLSVSPASLSSVSKTKPQRTLSPSCSPQFKTPSSKVAEPVKLPLNCFVGLRKRSTAPGSLDPWRKQGSCLPRKQSLLTLGSQTRVAIFICFSF